MNNSLSVCIIAKDAEKELERCLSSIKNIANEVILVDTGSKDNTPLIARKKGVKVYSFRWNNDFSAARNEALKYVKNQWVLFIDTDEELVSENLIEFFRLLDEQKKDSYYLQIENLLEGKEKTIVNRCRLFKSNSGYRYRGVIHETPEIDITKTGKIAKEIIYIKHYGYNRHFFDPERKKQRNLALIKGKNALENKIYLLSELDNKTNSQEKINLITEILKFLKQKSEKEISEDLFYAGFYKEAFNTFFLLPDLLTAEKFVLEGIRLFPNELTLLSMAGNLYFQMGNYDLSLNFQQKIISLVKEQNYLQGGVIHEGIKSYGTLYNIALCFKAKGDFVQAINFAKEAVKSNPDFAPAVKLSEGY